PGERRQRGEVVVRDERRGRPASAGVVEEGGAGAERDEEVAGRDAAGVDLDAGDVVCASLEPAQPANRVERQRDQVRAPSVLSASRAVSRSSKGTVRSANSC